MRVARGGAWSRDGVILFAPNSNGPLFKIPANGGEATAVTRVDSTRHETAHRFPRFLPDGRHYLFSVLGKTGRVTVVAGALGDTTRKEVCVADVGAAYSPSGHLLFTRNGVLSAQHFDFGSLQLSGEPLSLGDAVPPPGANGAPMVSVAEDRTLAYMFVPPPRTRMAWFDMGGHEVAQVPIAPGSYAGVSLSPDGRSALVNHQKSVTESELLVVDLERGTTNRISNEKVVENFSWAPDGKRVAYIDGSGGPQSIIVALADGSAPGEIVMPVNGFPRRAAVTRSPGTAPESVVGRPMGSCSGSGPLRTQWCVPSTFLPDRISRPVLRGSSANSRTESSASTSIAPGRDQS